jgi:hypothetical protein
VRAVSRITQGKVGQRIQMFGSSAWKEESSRRTRRKWEENIRNGLRKVLFGNMILCIWQGKGTSGMVL